MELLEINQIWLTVTSRIQQTIQHLKVQSIEINNLNFLKNEHGEIKWNKFPVYLISRFKKKKKKEKEKQFLKCQEIKWISDAIEPF